MFNMMAAYGRRLGISEQEVNEHCRQLQQAWNSGQNVSAEAICKQALQDKQPIATPHLRPPSAVPQQVPVRPEKGADKVALQEQHPNINTMLPRQSTYAETTQQSATTNDCVKDDVMKAGKRIDKRTADGAANENSVLGSNYSSNYQQPQARAKLPRLDAASDKLDARLLAIRRAHDENDDGDTRTRL